MDNVKRVVLSATVVYQIPVEMFLPLKCAFAYDRVNDLR